MQPTPQQLATILATYAATAAAARRIIADPTVGTEMRLAAVGVVATNRALAASVKAERIRRAP